MTAASQEQVHQREVLRELQALPNVGPSIAMDLWELGIRAPVDLRRHDPEELYARLCAMRGVAVDRCMLYVFRALTYLVSTPQPDPEKVMWWKWKDPVPSQRKRPARGARRARR